MPQLTKNVNGFFNYTILEKFEAGVALTGAEVKSAKRGNISLVGSYVTFKGMELWLIGCHIGPYERASKETHHESERDRKLLLRHTEIKSLVGKMAAEGLTLIPLSVYTKSSLIKVELGLARGKKKHDKRETIKKREANRRIRRAIGHG